MRTNYCGLIDSSYLGQSITVFGWAHRRRDHGGVIFIDLRDREGLLQIVIDPDTADAFKTADQSRNEYVMKVTGVVRNRPAGTVNANLKSGEIEVLAKQIEVLNASVTPPFMMDDDTINEETRLKYRTSIYAVRRCRQICAYGTVSRPPHDAIWTTKASSISKHRSCTNPRPKARGNFWCLRAFTTASFMRCRKVRNYLSSC